MKWPDDATDWPMREYSQHILCRPHRWHIQRAGNGPRLLLIHGAGGATQSWRNLYPLLEPFFELLAVDLPGQGFTRSGAQSRHGLDPMAEDLLSLLHDIDFEPDAIIGHSAGTAIALRMVEMECSAKSVLGINAALGNFEGVAGWLFPFLAKALALTPFAANVFATTTTRSSVRQLLIGTGSKIDERGEDLYYRLATNPEHVDGTLSMMAQWSLDGLLKRLGTITTDTHLLACTIDNAVPFSVSERADARLPNSSLTKMDGLGHLAHEEDAETVANWIFEKLQTKNAAAG
ncbi:magnesium chelatase accessory protein [Cognatiyoonia sediminum]|uniref:Magnesium chelatase accessory protein n=1 Tax=Cognatiyoonia sediminum TaxID=1508389 RepID=A0A1M5QZI1_9RHOB|nr:alpha/beta fold hydrolase BchO [Cognatiyoonia sediminum]SHH19318.1 magnesium chelatase accessory protein [Cognatiyoonia sediminum]